MPRCPQCFRRIAFGASCTRHDRAWNAPFAESAGEPPDEPGLPGYRVIRLIGRGGFGAVWEVESIESGKSYALKVAKLPTSLMRGRFIRDVEAMHKIGAPAVPEVIGAGIIASSGCPWILMELLLGETLADAMAKAEDPWPTAQILDIADRILSALAQAHALGFVHRDLKPENIFLCRSPFSVRLLDFGIGRHEPSAPEEHLTREGTALGSAEYMAPEQLAGGQYNGIAADIYAFGVVLFELLTLRLPFDASGAAATHAHLSLRPHRPSAFAPVPPAIDELVLDCLEKDPAHRPRSVDRIRDRIYRIVYGGASGSNAFELRINTINMSAPSRVSVTPQEPAVVLYTEVVGSPVFAAALVRSHHGVVARSRAGRLVGVFLGASARDPIAAAHACARAVRAQLEARVALHLASVRVRRHPGQPISIYGSAVDRPGQWLPTSNDWDGILMTAPLALAAAETEPAEHPELAGFFVPGNASTPFAPAPGTDDNTPLVGRHECIDQISQRIILTISQRAPSLTAVLGAPGMGKTRVAAEVVRSVLRGPDTIRALVLRGDAHAAAAPHGTFGALAQWMASENTNLNVLSNEIIELITGAPEDTPSITRAAASALLTLAGAASVLVVLDDAHLADGPTLDALELATLGGREGALAVVLAADPRLLDMRPRFGLRADHFDRIELTPLREDDAVLLASELLRPAEYVPHEALLRLAAWSAGNPGDLLDLCAALKRAGIVRPRPGAGTYYLATDMLDRIDPAPASQWLALRRLNALRPELADFVRLSAVLGTSFSRTEVTAVQASLDAFGAGGTAMDIGVAVNSLVLRNILRPAPGDRFAFVNPSFQAAVAALVRPEERAAIHRAALAYFRPRADLAAGSAENSIEWMDNSTKSIDAEAISCLVFHALAVGECAEAAAGALQLGQNALAHSDPADADRFFSVALQSHGGAPAHLRVAALRGRASARYRMLRVAEALADLESALKDADLLEDETIAAALLLEMATALDWASRYEDSARAVATAISRAASAPCLRARLSMAQGRTFFRNNQITDAIQFLSAAEQAARELSDMETLIISGLLFSSALVFDGRLDEAEAHFEELIGHCLARADHLHLGSAYANRALLWTARGASERAMDDLGRAIEYARVSGNPWLEHNATHNVAEMLYWNDQPAQALHLARRARVLGQRFVEHPIAEDALLLARILCVLGNDGEARVHLDWITQQFHENDLGPISRALFVTLKLALSEARDAVDAERWRCVQAECSPGLPPEEQIETGFWRLWAALRHGRPELAREHLPHVQALVVSCPIWSARISRIATRLDELHGRRSSASSSGQSEASESPSMQNHNE